MLSRPLNAVARSGIFATCAHHSSALAAFSKTSDRPRYRALALPFSAVLSHGVATNKTRTADRFEQSTRRSDPSCRVKDLAHVERRPSPGKVLHLHGYLASQRVASKHLAFVPLLDTDLSHSIQLVASSRHLGQALFDRLLAAETLVPVSVTGQVKVRDPNNASTQGPLDSRPITSIELALTDLVLLNDFPKDDITIAQGRILPAPDQRYLQIRTDRSLREALILRNAVTQTARDFLCNRHDFLEVETPVLFKSTPEGAREFLVPTRTRGQAYALPQSPQQFKQLLMASGLPRYMQFAKCFRDEDLRADRQPEFTQLDMEMAFATDQDVMNVVEELVKELWRIHLGDCDDASFDRLMYDQAMSIYGSDKPDRRRGSEIHKIGHLLPVDMISKISNLKEPIVEALKLSTSDSRPPETRGFISAFMDSPAAKSFITNPDGQPGIFVYDAGKPLHGLQPLGFAAVKHLEEILDLTHGDLVVLQARPATPHVGTGSTPLGNLRLALHRAATDAHLLPEPKGWDFLWVTDFPLFTPTAQTWTSTHHPFTAPKTTQDLSRILASPPELASARAAHYDLVLNGTELGGGSVRIHDPELQRIVFDVLGLSDAAVERDFGHLLRALKAGCPPHAGFAFGFDRLVAAMCRRSSVRDVIAFPKSGEGGRDATVGAPGVVGDDTWSVYHLRSK